MREIKFRAWSEPDKKMYYDIQKEEWIIKAFKGNYKGISIMQFTGVKDKNGKEIYEGDILVNGGYIYECIFWEGCFIANRFDKKPEKKQGYHALNVLEVKCDKYSNPLFLSNIMIEKLEDFHSQNTSLITNKGINNIYCCNMDCELCKDNRCSHMYSTKNCDRREISMTKYLLKKIRGKNEMDKK